MIRLCVVTASGRQRFETDRAEVLLGSREGADLRIEADGVAANHCVLKIQGNRLVLVDLGSAEGVRFAGDVVRQADLQAGSAFRIGDALIEVERFAGGPGLPRAPSLQLAPPPPAPPHDPVPTGHGPDFATELKRKLAATPWYGISMLVHAVILFIFSLIPYESRAVVPERSIQATIGADVDDTDIAPAEMPPDPEEAEQAAAPEPDDFERMIEDTERKPQQVEPEIPPIDKPPEVIGFGQPPQNVRIRPLRNAKKNAKVADGEKAVDRSNVKGEQQRAAGVVAKGLGRGLSRLQAIPRHAIVVVEGEYDEMQEVLKIYKIPHTLVKRHQLVSYDLKRAKVLCINCGRSPSPLIEEVLVENVAKFAKAGGWVIGSDWALAPYLTGAFPKYIKEYRPRRSQPDTTVDVKPKGRTSPLIEGVFADKQRTRWWIEDSSKFVAPAGGKVSVLIHSDEMRERWGNGNIAVEFRPSKKGRVIYLMGHFFQKDGNRAGVVGMHRLVLNFLLERFRITGSEK